MGPLPRDPGTGSVTVTKDRFQKNLAAYLGQFPELNVIADRPENIVHFCAALMPQPGIKFLTPPLVIELVERFDLQSEVPHNALSDACACTAQEGTATHSR